MSPRPYASDEHEQLAAAIRPRQTTAQAVAAALRGRLLAGDYAPGSPMRESALASALGVSRPTIREALQHLVREGLLTHHLNRGMVVAELGADDVRELYVVRVALETAGISAAARGDGTPTTVSVDAALAAFETAVAAGDRLGVVDADMAFHGSLVGLADSRRLVAYHATVMSQQRLALGRFDTAFEDDVERQFRDHKRMARLLGRGEYDKLERELRSHLRRASDRLADFVSG